MSSTSTPISQPCHERLGVNPPTATSRPCLAYPTAVVDFIRLPRAAGLAAGGAHQRVCVASASPPYLGLRRLRRGLLAMVALCAWQSAAGQVQVPTSLGASAETVVVRGVIFDDSLNVPVPGLWLYLNNTKYGAITNAQGEFTFSFPAEWKPVRGGVLRIRAVPAPYTFKPQQVPLDWRRYDPAHPLVLRLASAPGRGRSNLHGSILMAPPVPPPVYPARARAARR